MIFIVFLVPLALYLLLLGHINRQSRPVFVSGTLDFIGILFAASGFLFLGGPAILTSLNESWRSFWMLGDNNISRDSFLAQWQFWVFLSALYFSVVVVGCLIMFRKQRHLTSIYNVEPAAVGATVEEVCAEYGLSPIRSGSVFVFGPGLEQAPAAHSSPEGIQKPHSVLMQKTQRLDVPATLGDEFVGQNAVLEIEAFGPMKHATLRWEPADSPLRGVLEAAVEQRLGQIGAPYHETGLWLTLAGYGLLGLSLFIGLVMVVRAILVR